MDVIMIEDLLLQARIEDGTRWPASATQNDLQPVYMTVEMRHECSRVASTDDLSKSINYGSVSARVQEASRRAVDNDSEFRWRSTEELCAHIYTTCFHEFPDIQDLSLRARRPDAVLNAESVTYTSRRRRGESTNMNEAFSFSHVPVSTIIGVNASERIEQQPVVFDVDILRPSPNVEPFDFRAVGRTIFKVIFRRFRLDS
jgi:dihydroneopterin aldolase/2-amino-4-hydroxy-6-hydroxymethyldihydropteridine diphosphokinase/dihydropteroate synthase